MHTKNHHATLMRKLKIMRTQPHTDVLRIPVRSQGAKSNDMNDEQCVKVSMVKISVSEATAAKKLQEFVGGKASSINVPQIASATKKY